MAEVPLPTPTQVPVPSTDIRNAVFAGAKLDEEVTGNGEFYTDRLGVKRLTNTGRNNQFDAAQLDRANRFEQFLLSSGYVFLGDYEDGPFQFSARNQYIRYNNQYYRLNAATDVGFTTTGTDATSFANDVTHFVLMDGDTLRQNLRSGDEGMGGDLVQANQTYTVSDILRRMRTLGDVGAGRPAWGYDTSSDVKIYNAQAGEGADDIMMNGGLFLARKFRGTSRFAVVSGIRGGRASVDDSGAFRAQVVSVSSSLGIANYGLHDGVSDYADALLPALESWETVASATYTANTVTISPETYSETLKNILKGDVIRTRHSSRYWGTVQSVNPQTGVITVDMWALKDNPNLTPENDGSGFYLNFIDKVWADNKNVIVQPNSAGLYATVGEFGALVQKAGMGYVNGMDMVLLAGSTQDATAAFLARSGASGHGWLYGFNAQGNRFNFYSDSGEVTPYAGFLENSNAIVGMKFRNKNTYSQAWSNSTDLTAVNPSALTAIIGPAGHVFRRPERILTLSASGMLDQFYPTVYVTAAGITITMPDITQMPVAGYVFKVRLFLAGTYIFNTYQGQTTIDGNPQLTVTTTSARQTIEIQFDGTFWQTFLR
ncbi:hypothetical protein [Raoultella ornithinolytica]|uniref:hypothetical protein n=1 Tax=Raoultella ornithinolytica TaxID=54291 RepID=UPI0019CFC2BB|nr:hypothetical protein [Raoultella ornithinolytica]